MRRGPGMERPMGEGGADVFPFFKESTCFSIEVCCNKMFPDVVLGLFAGMNHVAFIESIVAQIVHHDFECRIIFYTLERLSYRATGGTEYGFAETVSFYRIPEM